MCRSSRRCSSASRPAKAAKRYRTFVLHPYLGSEAVYLGPEGLRPGDLVLVPFGRRHELAIVAGEGMFAPEAPREILAVLARGFFPAMWTEFLDHLAERCWLLPGEIFRRAMPPLQWQLRDVEWERGPPPEDPGLLDLWSRLPARVPGSQLRAKLREAGLHQRTAWLLRKGLLVPRWRKSLPRAPATRGMGFTVQPVSEVPATRQGQILLLCPTIQVLESLHARHRFTVLYHSELPLREQREAWRRAFSGEPGIYATAEKGLFLWLPRLRALCVVEPAHPAYHPPFPELDLVALSLLRARYFGVPWYWLGFPDFLFAPDPSCWPKPRIVGVRLLSARRRQTAPRITEELAAILSSGGSFVHWVAGRDRERAWCPRCERPLRCARCGRSFLRVGLKAQCPRCNRKLRRKSCPQCGASWIFREALSAEILEALGRLFPGQVSLYPRRAVHTVVPREAYHEAGRLPGKKVIWYPERILGEELRQVLWGAAVLAEVGAQEGSIWYTLRPRHSVLRILAEGRLQEFLEHEMQMRRTLDLPPYASLLEVEIRKPADLAGEHLELLLGDLPRPSSVSGPLEGQAGIQYFWWLTYRRQPPTPSREVLYRWRVAQGIRWRWTFSADDLTDPRVPGPRASEGGPASPRDHARD